ncbi:MAG: preprotein translocase subunit SecG [Lachnospiraceae bacterium]|nr:preprotein translocase subunit SecG [Lachnospiraceae bacterium]
MDVLRYILTSLFALLGLVLTVIVILQEGKSAGLGAIGGLQDTFWEKNKSRSKEGHLERFTKFVAIGFFVLAFVLTINF